MNKSQSNAWFKKSRGSFLPNNLTGLFIYLTYVAYLVALIVSWFIEGYNFWNLITAVIPLAAAAALFVQYIASKHSK